MEEIVNLIATDSSATDISDRLKDVLFAKSANKIESQRSSVADTMFAEPETEVEPEPTEETE